MNEVYDCFYIAHSRIMSPLEGFIGISFWIVFSPIVSDTPLLPIYCYLPPPSNKNVLGMVFLRYGIIVPSPLYNIQCNLEKLVIMV